MNYQPEKLFSTQELIILLYKKKWLIVSISVIAAIFFVVYALLLPNYYKSEVVLYPASSSSVSQTLLSINAQSRDILKFGEDEEVEQVQQILESEIIRNTIIQKYDLFKHYDIDLDSKYKTKLLYDTYSDNVSIKRTKYNSIKIQVLDQSPDTAALIANDISDLLDTTMNHLQKTRAIEAFNIVKREYQYLQDDIRKLNDSLTVLRNLGINDYESQAEVLNQALGQAILKGNKKAEAEINKKLAILSKYGSAYVQLSNYLEYQTEQSSILKLKYAEASVDAKQNLSHKFIISKAYPSEKPAYPIRWLIVVGGTLASFILTLLLIAFFEGRKKFINKLD